MMMKQQTLHAFLKQQALPPRYGEIAMSYFAPLAYALTPRIAKRKTPFFIAINGAQGSGKTTVADFLAHYFNAVGLPAIALSIDDFYLPRHTRQALSQNVHPLLKTRGVPGTHDVGLLHKTFSALQAKRCRRVVRFDKAQDDRLPVRHWQKLKTAPQVVILEGWCVLTPAQQTSDLQEPINALERDEDKQAIFRHYVNRQLATDYTPFFAQFDYKIMLKAPDFSVVYNWRKMQEDKLRQRLQAQVKSGKQQQKQRLLDDAALMRFIAHYQRLTEHSLATVPALCDTVYHLDAMRNIEKTHHAFF